MMQPPAIALGLRLQLLAETPDAAAAQVIPACVVGDWAEPATVLAFGADCPVVTFDHEHVPTAILQRLLAAGVAVRPGPAALVHAQDKAVMRERLTAMGVPCPAHQVVVDPAALVEFGQRHGWPVIAKASRGGYDGNGVWRVDDPQRAGIPFEGLQGLRSEAVVIAEEFVDFTRELSVLVARRPDGELVSYPVSETLQRGGICAATTTPAPELSPQQAADLQAMAERIATELEVVGILAVELMQRPDGSVVVNELAMRPHNTGHWSIDGCGTSQFENHLRAVADLPLGSVETKAPVTVMVNVLGGSRRDLLEATAELMAEDPAVKVHWYGKQFRPGRKLGHVTVLDQDVETATRRAWRAANHLMGAADE